MPEEKPTYEELEKRIRILEKNVVTQGNPNKIHINTLDQFSFLLNNVSDIIWMLDMEYNIIYVNSAAEKITGYTLDEIKKLTLKDILTPESKKEAIRALRNIYEKTESNLNPGFITVDLEHLCSDGSTFWGECNFSIKYEGSSPVAIFGVTRDISKYREVKIDLEKREKLYRSAIKAADGVSYYHNIVAKKYEFIDDGIEELIGFTKDEMHPGIWDSIILESSFWGDYRGMKYRGAKDHAESKGDKPLWKAEFKIKKKDGEVVWLADTSVLIYNEKGKAIASLGILQDINERKNAEELLETEHNLLKTIIDNIPAAVAVKDLDSKIILCNYRSVQNYKKSSTEDIIGKTDHDLIDKQLADRFRKEEVEVFETGKPVLNKVISSSDKKKWGSIFKVPLYNKNGEINHIVTINYDITELMLKEKENRELERQLFHSQKMESIGRIAGGLAHDFNNILAGIMGYGELLKIHFEDTDSLEGQAAEVIYEAAIKASKLTKQLLNFSRKEKHKVESINVNNIIENALKISERIFDERIVVKTEFEKDIMMTEANESQLDQVFTNLLINAYDAMPNGGEIIISTQNVSFNENDTMMITGLEKGEYVKIEFADQGVGIPPELEDKIFEPFFSTKGPEKGTGLGLATVYAIIKNSRGHIIFNSDQSKGTVFTIFLPVSYNGKTFKNKVPKLVRGKGKILVIDDDKTVLELVDRQLTYLGYKTVLAAGGEDGVSKFREMNGDCDLVIVDIIMPKMDGFETFMNLKSIDPRVKVIAASGYSKESKAENLLNSGALTFIQKPFRMAELSNMIKMYV